MNTFYVEGCADRQEKDPEAVKAIQYDAYLSAPPPVFLPPLPVAAQPVLAAVADLSNHIAKSDAQASLKKLLGDKATAPFFASRAVFLHVHSMLANFRFTLQVRPREPDCIDCVQQQLLLVVPSSLCSALLSLSLSSALTSFLPLFTSY